MGRRTLLLIASILVAAVGTALIFLYVRGADQRANEATELVNVVVAKKDIPQGTTVTDAVENGAFELKGVPRGILPPGRFEGTAGLSELQQNGQNAALIDITTNTIVARSAFGGAGEATSTGVAKGKVVVSAQMTDPNRVAGLLKPGTIIAVIVTTDPASQAEAGYSLANRPEVKISISGALMNDAKVVSVGSAGQAEGSGSGEAVDNKIVALEVTPKEALLVRAGEKVGELSIAIPSSPESFPLAEIPAIKVILPGPPKATP